MGLPFFHSLPLSFEGIFYSSPSLALCPHFFFSFSFFYFMLWCSLFFALVSSGAVVLFYRAKFVEPGLRLSLSLSLCLQLAVCISLLYFSLLLLPLSLLLSHSHPFPLTSFPPKAQFHSSSLPSLQPLSFLQLNPLIKSQSAVSRPSTLLLLFTLFCVYSAFFSPQLVKNSMPTWLFNAPGLWNRWLFLRFSLRPSDLVCVSDDTQTHAS